MKMLRTLSMFAAVSIASATAVVAQQSDQPPAAAQPAPLPDTRFDAPPARQDDRRTMDRDRPNANRGNQDVDRGPRQADRASGPTDNQIANEADARVARLKASLQLTVDQENSWPRLQQALRDYGVTKLREKAQVNEDRGGRRRRGDRPAEAQQPDNDIVLMRKEADSLSANAAALRKLADAADPLYQALNDRQRRLLVRAIVSEFDR